jgi:P4 family phage/plasmid primase-like protien
MTNHDDPRWKMLSDTSIPGEERARLRDELFKEDPVFMKMLEQQSTARREEMYHDIARRLRDKQGFLFSAREFIKEQPLHYDKNRIWWLWNHTETRWEISDETEILNILTIALRTYGVGDTTVKYKANMLEALRQEGRLNQPKPFPKHWIQFKDVIFDLQSKQTFPSSPEWFSTNPIPWSLGTDSDTPEISRLFDEWVGPEYSETLFEIIAYCCYSAYPIHRLFCLNGGGRNGKSTFQGLITRFIGAENTCSMELDELTEKSNRFSSFALYKKLCCLMGETNFNLITNSNMLKKLTGGDLIKFEMKGGQPFADYNYAKILISTNHLPPSADQSDGYYSRWVIIDFPNQFPEAMEILSKIPEYEYRNLAKKVSLLLPELLAQHGFSKQGTIDERRQRYIERSNPLLHFVQEFYVRDFDASTLYSTMFVQYASWLKKQQRRPPSQKVFSQMLNIEGYEIRKTSYKNENGQFENVYQVFGLRLKESVQDFSEGLSRPFGTDRTVGTEISTHTYTCVPIRNSGPNGENAPIRAINASAGTIFPVQSGNCGEKSGPTPPRDFPCESDILSALQSLNEASFAVLESLFPGCENLLSMLSSLCQKGEVFSPRPDVYKVLS